MASTGALAMLVVVALVASPRAESAALTCGQVYNGLMPCLNYIQTGGKSPPAACCDGVRDLISSAKTTQDRQTACGCLKTLAAGVNGSYLQRAAGIPQKCGVNVPFKISPSADCSKVK